MNLSQIPPTPASPPRCTRTGGLPIVMNFALLAAVSRPMTLLHRPVSFQKQPARQPFVTTRALQAALRYNQGHCLNCHDTWHSFKRCKHPFTKASRGIDPELGQLGDNGDAYRRWQIRMLSYRRGNETGGAGNSFRKGRRHRSGRQQGQGHTHNSGHNSQDARSGYPQQGSDGGYGQNTNALP